MRMRRYANSLVFKIALIVILVEMVVLGIEGYFYTKQFVRLIDQRIEEQVTLPGILMNTSLLSLASLADQQTMTELVGETLIDAWAVDNDGRIFSSFNPDFRGQLITDIPDVNPMYFDFSNPETHVNATNDYIESITPIDNPNGGDEPRLFVYIRVERNLETQLERTAIIRLFVVGSIITLLVTSTLLIFLLRSTISRRIYTTLRIIKQVEDDNLSVRVFDETSSDEIGVLRRGINEMISTLEKRNHQRLQTEKILQTRLRLTEYAMTHSVDDIMKKFIVEVETFTSSTLGFLYMWDDERKTILLPTNAALDNAFANNNKPHFPINIEQVKTCIQEKCRVIHHDYTTDVGYKNILNTPDSITRNLIVPIIRDEKTVAILRVCNKPEPYTETDIEVIYQIANIGWDIIARKLMETKLHQSEELVALKNRFVSTVSHEFRTPLAIIQSSTDLLLRYNSQLSEEKREQSFTRIQRQINLLTELIDDVLSIGRAQSGRIVLNLNPLELEPFCHMIFEQIQFMDEGKHQFELICDVPENELMLDRYLLKHILTNLLTNAVKYSEDGTSIYLESSHTTSHVTFKVRDNGIGIPETELLHLFEPFYRATNIDNQQGTGLGLSIVKEYVDLHGGDVSVESQLGIGTTFTVIIPIA